MSEEELEARANDCLTVEQAIMSLDREIADHYKEILAINRRYLAPEDKKHKDRALRMFESGIRYNRARIAELRGL